MLLQAETWVAVAFLLFIGLMLYMGVPKTIGKALDKRSLDIKNDLEEARRLREEAKALLADYEKKRKGAEAEAQAIVEQARTEAAAFAAESQAALSEQLERRTKLAVDKIARAQAQAVGEVRLAAIEAAIGAAEKLIGAKLNDNTAADIVGASIRELKAKL